MPEDGFGSGLWKNVQAVELGPDGELQAPVRADGHEGIVIGVDQVAASDASAAQGSKAPRSRRSPGRWARLTRR